MPVTGLETPTHQVAPAVLNGHNVLAAIVDNLYWDIKYAEKDSPLRLYDGNPERQAAMAFETYSESNEDFEHSDVAVNALTARLSRR